MVYDSATVLINFESDKQLILLSILQHGKSIKFDSYTSRDAKVCTALLNARQAVTLME